MIIARSPLRVSLGGGGTDLASYACAHEGFLIAAAIDRYVYVAVNSAFHEATVLRHDSIEEAQSVDTLRHPIIREALRVLDLTGGGLEITTLSDVPGGTGLGSSGSLGTALLKALHRFLDRSVDARSLAEMASHIEIGVLGAPVGKQDTYAAAFGGVNAYTFHTDGTVTVSPLYLSPDTLERLTEHLMLFWTGRTRSASTILREQDQRTRQHDRAMIDSLHEVKAIGRASHAALEAGDLQAFGRLMHAHWESKKTRASGMSFPEVDRWYQVARDNGAIGGKLVGAGGGGFLMLCADDPSRLRAAMRGEGLRPLRFGFDFEGTALRA